MDGWMVWMDGYFSNKNIALPLPLLSCHLALSLSPICGESKRRKRETDCVLCYMHAPPPPPPPPSHVFPGARTSSTNASSTLHSARMHSFRFLCTLQQWRPGSFRSLFTASNKAGSSPSASDCRILQPASSCKHALPWKNPLLKRKKILGAATSNEACLRAVLYLAFPGRESRAPPLGWVARGRPSTPGPSLHPGAGHVASHALAVSADTCAHAAAEGGRVREFRPPRAPAHSRAG